MTTCLSDELSLLAPWFLAWGGIDLDEDILRCWRRVTDRTFSRVFVALHRDESGQDLIEYALVAALIAFAAVAGMSYVASEINNAFSTIGNKLSNAVS
jgi:pilus assembly protein Flp/PilA